MRIGIVVHSDTGNTLQVAETLRSKLRALGHEVMVEQLEAAGVSKPGDLAAQPASIPDLASYEGLVFAAPVHAFSLSALMRRTLPKVEAVQGKPVALFVTQGFPFPWLGGNHAMRQMVRLAEAQGALIRGTGVINWPRQGIQVEPLTERLSQAF